MNKKGAMSIEQLGLIVLSLISLAVIMTMIYPLFVKSGGETGEKSKCELSIVLGSLSRFGGVERISPACKANILNIDQKLITSNSLLAKQELSKISELKNNPDYKELTSHFNDPSNKEQVTELITNKIIAKEMMNCWDKVVHGKLGMFDEWYNLFDLKLFGVRKGDYEANKQKFAEDLVGHWSGLGLFEKWGPPKFCVLCSDITFSKDIKSQEVKSFNAWLKATPHPYFKDRSIYEFLVKDQEYDVEPYYQYEISPGKQYAVVFERVNTHQIRQLSSYFPFVPDTKDSINRLVLTEYDNVVKPFEERGESCFRIID